MRVRSQRRLSPEELMFRIVVLEKTLESPLDSKEIKPVNPKRNQPWIIIGRTDAEAEASILWPPNVMSRLIGKDPDAGKDWGREKKRVIGDEMVGWHHHKLREIVKDRETGHAAVHGVAKSWTWLRHWTTTTINFKSFWPRSLYFTSL